MDLAVHFWWRAAALESLLAFITHVLSAPCALEDAKPAVESIAQGLAPLLDVCGGGSVAHQGGFGAWFPKAQQLVLCEGCKFRSPGGDACHGQSSAHAPSISTVVHRNQVHESRHV